jgi:hypothetical protein
MAIEKSLYAAPEGIGQLNPDGLDDQTPELELEIVNPDMVRLDDGSVEITIIPGQEQEMLDGVPFDANLAEYISDSEMATLVTDLIADYDNDISSRKDWEQAYTDGIKLLGLKYEERTEPWPGACGVHSPIIAEAAVRFQAEAIMETFPAKGPVKTQIIGDITPENTDAAQRVEDDMNYELTEVMREYRSEHEKMLWNLPIAGSAFKKVYFDPSLGRQVSMFVPAEDIILPYGTSEISQCERITHRMRKTMNQLVKLQESGFYRSDIEIPDGPVMQPDEIQKAKDQETGFSATYDDRPLLLEMHVEIDLPGFEDKNAEGEPTGIALPYVVTILKETNVILSIRRNWEPDGEDTEPARDVEGDDEEAYEPKKARQYFVHYQYVPGFGSYGYGLIHLVGNSTKGATSITRQLVDAGTLSNLPGGMKTRGLRIKGDDTPIAPGEFRDVDVSSGALRDNIMPLPYKEPSQTLLQLRGIITEEAQKFAAAPDMKISDMSANAPVGTTLALIERNLKVMSAVQARMHFSMKQELKLLARLIRDYATSQYGYTPEKGKRRDRKADYSMVDVIPVSNPNASTLAQRVVQYQAVIQLAQMAPQIYNLPKLHRQMLEVLNIKEADKLVPLEDDQKPTDPVSENMNILMGKPVKAFIYQDHEAHIRTHMAAMQDPQIAQIMGQNPQAQILMQAANAHITEHVAMAYRQKMEQQLGMSLPEPDAELPRQIEYQLSGAIAQAAGQLLGKHQAEAQAQQNAQMQQDPIVQMQQAELQLKAKEVELKEKQIMVDAATQADKLALEREKLKAENEREGLKIGLKAQYDESKLKADNERDGLRIGAEIAKSREKMKHERHRQDVDNMHQALQSENKPMKEPKK